MKAELFTVYNRIARRSISKSDIHVIRRTSRVHVYTPGKIKAFPYPAVYRCLKMIK